MQPVSAGKKNEKDIDEKTLEKTAERFESESLSDF